MGRYMGRYTSEGVEQLQPNSTQNLTWPTTFQKPVVGFDLSGTIIENRTLYNEDCVRVLPGACEGIKVLRLKGYKVCILADQPDISKGLITQQSVDIAFQKLMKIFGEQGIYSIDGFLYNTSSMKEDLFAKPNLGMVKKAEKEILLNKTRFSKGWYAGDSLVDLKFAERMGAVPVLIRSGDYQHALDNIDKFAYKKIKSRLKVFSTILEFANSLP